MCLSGMCACICNMCLFRFAKVAYTFGAPTLACCEIFHAIGVCGFIFKIDFFILFFREYHQHVKRFWLRSGPRYLDLRPVGVDLSPIYLQRLSAIVTASKKKIKQTNSSNKNTFATGHAPEKVQKTKLKKKTGPVVIKLFPCSTQLSTKFILLVNVENANNYNHNCRHFNILTAG